MFSYFYAAIQYNPIEIANNLEEQRRVYPGLPSRTPDLGLHNQGHEQDYAVRSDIPGYYRGIADNSRFVFEYFGLAIGGTSILIVVGVALENRKAA